MSTLTSLLEPVSVPEALPYRLDPSQLAAALARGAILVDIRPQPRRTREGALPGALALDLRQLPTLLDPHSPGRLTRARHHGIEWVLVCGDGTDSPAATASLRQLGLFRVTDVAGGFVALRRARLCQVASAAPHFVHELDSLAQL